MPGYLLETQDLLVSGVSRRAAPLSIAIGGGETTAFYTDDARLGAGLAGALAGFGHRRGELIFREKSVRRPSRRFRQTVALLSAESIAWRGSVGELIQLNARLHQQFDAMTATKTLARVGIEPKMRWRDLDAGHKALTELQLTAARQPRVLILDRFLARLAAEPAGDVVLKDLEGLTQRFDRAIVLIETPGSYSRQLTPKRLYVLNRGGVALEGASASIRDRFHLATLEFARTPADFPKTALHGEDVWMSRRGRFITWLLRTRDAEAVRARLESLGPKNLELKRASLQEIVRIHARLNHSGGREGLFGFIERLRNRPKIAPARRRSDRT